MIKNVSIISLLSILVAVGCSSDDKEDSLAGTYEVYKIELSNCADPLSNLDITYQDPTVDCIETTDFVHCKSGSLIVRADNSFTSTIAISRGSTLLGISFPLISLNGQGILDVSGNIVNLCIDNSCTELQLSNGDLISSFRTIGCDHRYVFRKLS